MIHILKPRNGLRKFLPMSDGDSKRYEPRVKEMRRGREETQGRNDEEVIIGKANKRRERI